MRALQGEYAAVGRLLYTASDCEDRVEAAWGGEGRALAPADRHEHTVSAIAAVSAFTQLHAYGASAQQRHCAVVGEFVEYLSRYGERGRDSLGTCTDLEVLAFLHTQYVPSHVGRGRAQVCGTTLSKVLTELGRAFAERGRVGPWSVTAQGQATGSPSSSHHVRKYLTGYTKWCKQEGWLEKSATPLSESAYVTLMEGMDREIDLEMSVRIGVPWPSVELLVLLRDAAAFAVMWHSSRRGADVLGIRWGGVTAAGTGKCVLEPWGGGWGRDDAWDDTLWVVPTKTKTEQLGRPSTVVLSLCERFTVGCAIRRMRWYWEAQVVAGVQVRGGDPVFRCHRGGAVRGITAPALQHRLRRAEEKHLQSRCYTLHSFRRGRLQNARAGGASLDELQQLAGIKDVGVLMRYLDQGRHV